METKLCRCGRPLYYRWNSKILMKLCPACQIEEAKKEKVLKKRINVEKAAPAMRTADRWFSRYIRLLHSFPDSSGKELLCKCYTCGRIKPMLHIDNGHYHSRSIKATRYHINNGRPQCKRCNRYLQGAHTAFERHLIEEVGLDAVEELKSLTNAYFKADRAFFVAALETYRDLFKELTKTKGNPWKTTPKKKC